MDPGELFDVSIRSVLWTPARQQTARNYSPIGCYLVAKR